MNSEQTEVDKNDITCNIQGDGPARPATHMHRFTRQAVVVAAISVTVFFLYMIRIFFVPLILAATFTVLFYPFYTWILKRLRGNRMVSSVLCCIALATGLMIPLYAGAMVVANQSIEMVKNIGPQARTIISTITTLFRSMPQSENIQSFLKLNSIDWQTPLNNSVATIGATAAKIITQTSAGMFNLLFVLVSMLFIMFYFFVDGEKIIARIRTYSPFATRYEDAIFNRFALVSRATVKGTIVIGVVQGVLGSVTLLVFGIKSWLIWGLVMVLLSILPLVGAWLVLVPAGIIQIILGNPWAGLSIILICIVIISNIDNFIRPRIVGQNAKMHDLLVFFSTLGGISVFGVMGFIVGPVIAAFFMSMVEIYREEFLQTT